MNFALISGALLDRSGWASGCVRPSSLVHTWCIYGERLVHVWCMLTLNTQPLPRRSTPGQPVISTN